MQRYPLQMVMGLVLVARLALSPGWSADHAPTISTVSVTTRPALNVAEALEALSDEDPATRQKALAALEGCTDKDIPALEKAALNSDLEIRNRAALILKKVKRGEAAVIITFVDGSPAAGLKFSGKLLFFPPMPLNQDKAKEDEKRRKTVGPHGEECAGGEYTTDAGGKLSFGRFSDGAYQIELTSPEGFPRQRVSLPLKLTFGATPPAWTLQRGITAKVTVVDEAGQPLEGVTIACIENAHTVSSLKEGYPQGEIVAVLATLDSATSDAKGVGVLTHILSKGQTIGACKAGWQLTTQILSKCMDGGQSELTLTMRKLVPVEVKVACKDNAQKPLGQVRVLLVRSADESTCLGEDWALALNREKIDACLVRGAIDAGTTSDKGELTLKVLPDGWSVVGFPTVGGEVLYGRISIGLRSTKVPACLSPLRQPQVTDGGKEICRPREKILCPPAQAQAGVVGDPR